MKKYFYSYGNRYKYKRIVGISLAIIGLLILINVMSATFLLALIGIALILMGILLYMK